MAVNGKSKLWAIRMPGGPTRVISSKTEIDEEYAKEIYMESFKYRSTEVKNDPDLVWPLIKPLDETSVREYAKFMEVSSVTGKYRGLVEV